MTRFVTGSAAVYAQLLRLCPGELRAEFAQEMTLVFSDDLADSVEHGGPAAAFRVWSHAAAELALLTLSNLVSIEGVPSSLIAGALALICFTLSAKSACVLVPMAAAAVVACLAARSGLRARPQSLLD